MNEPVYITDVAPRDGLQNEPGVIGVAQKVALITRLMRSGVDEIEVTSFVSPKWVPQLGDCANVCDALADMGERRIREGPLLSALVPNEKGMAAALEANDRAGFELLGKVSVFTAASETFALRNTNGSIAQTIERFVPVVKQAHEAGLLVRGYVSCVIACPFEGAISPAQVVAVIDRLADIGVDEFDLGDTIGAATPDSTRRMLESVAVRYALGDEIRPVTLHLHDTFGHAAACVKTALEMGVRSFDGAAGGLGGCPYASTPERRAPGNIATELLTRTILEAGYDCGIDEPAMADAGALARSLV